MHTTPEADLPIAITAGDPAGIGPELLVRAVHELRVRENRPTGVQLRLYGDRSWLHATAVAVGIDPVVLDAPGVEIVDCAPVPPELVLGQVQTAGGEAAFRAIDAAARDALAGSVRALVTAPLHKEALHRAGHRYPGHTELLAEIAGGVPVRMMLENEELRTVLVSIHIPLRDAVLQLNQADIQQTISITHDHFRRNGYQRPRITVAGLNPHAGEGGLIGREEIDIIAPAIRAARDAGIEVDGPWPPDTVFMQARGFARWDVVIALYHDQGLIPVKYLGLDQGVNVTLGLPFVRTSPDHGTAFDIVRRRCADPASLLAAIRSADRATTTDPRRHRTPPATVHP